jgi:integrase/recombinase XerD
MQLKQACADFLAGYFSTHERRAKTKTAYELDLAQFTAFAGSNLEVLDISSSVIEHWAAHLRKSQYAPASIRRKIVVLKVFFGYWLRKGLLRESPFWRVRLSFGRITQLPRTLTEQEMKALLVQTELRTAVPRGRDFPSERSARPSHVPGYLRIRNQALLDVLFATGMRVGEVSTLDISDFSVQEGMFRIRGKGGRDRIGFAVDDASLRLQLEHLKARSRIQTHSHALFLNVLGNRLSTQGITNIISQLRRAANIERHVTPHMLRHTVATLLLRNGVDIRVVQEFLGHASIATTQRYTHISKEHLISVLRMSHPSFRLRSEGCSMASGASADTEQIFTRKSLNQESALRCLHCASEGRGNT